MIDHFSKEYPREACGLIISGKFYPCKNIASDDDDFQFDTQEYLSLILKYGTPEYIVHTHPDCSPEPSPSDIANCNALGIPFLIYSYPSLERYELLPRKSKIALLGRHYKFGIFDCFEAARDYYLFQGIELPPRLPFKDDWWYEGIDYFSSEYFKHYGFMSVDTLEEGDLMVFSVNSEIPNHCGVYIGKDLFYHHAFNRLSCRESIYPFWKKFHVGTYRYEEKSLPERRAWRAIR